MTVKLVLKPTSEETDVKLIAMLKGWQVQRETLAEATIPRQIVWTSRDNSTTITYVEDELLLTRYLTITGPDEQTVADQVKAGLEVYGPEDVRRLRSSDLSAQEAVALTNVTAVMAPEDYQAEFFELINKALAHPALDVRRAAVFATTYVPWRQFRETLRQLAQADSALARDVEVVIDAIDAQGWR